MDILSEKSVIEQHPWVKDVQEELDRKKKEQTEAQAQNDIYAGALGGHNHGNDVMDDGE